MAAARQSASRPLDEFRQVLDVNLVGAWLGFHATADLAALLTAIVGAIAGANLTLILLDAAQARSAEVATEPRVDAPPAVVS